MRFIDSNVFIHAILKPTRKLARHGQEIKEAAKAILKRIEEGEKATTTVVHLSEIATILESQLSETLNIEINDALAHLIMTELQIREIYRFDKHHDNIPQTKRITQ